MRATLANMRTVKASGAVYSGPNRVVLLDRSTGETFSADPADYWMMDDTDVQRGEDGRPLVLASRRPSRFVRMMEGA